MSRPRASRPSRAAHLAALVFGAANLLLSSTAAGTKLPRCSGKKIYVLDLNDFAGSNPKCDVNEVAIVNPGNGIVYTADVQMPERASHKYGTHSAPWYVAEAIKGSSYVTEDINEADIVFVDSYCYYIWWLGWVHTKGREHADTPGDYLVATFTEMVKSERWRRNGGRDFVFYDSHPGFTAGKASQVYWAFVCHIFKDSMHIVVERAQRNVCPTYWEQHQKLLITPYVPNFISTEDQYGSWESPLKPLAQRKTFLYSKARCTPFKVDNQGTVINVGKKMRHDFATTMQKQGTDIQVECTDSVYGQKHEKFSDMLAGMQDSIFCLGLPGDAASVRRMSEMFMAGCIPVFAGPPYATMPLPDDVDYRKIGLFYNISDYRSWQTQDFQWAIHPTVRANHPQNSWFWVPDADVQSLMINVPKVDDVIPDLRKIPRAKLDAMFEFMESQRQMFVFYDHLTPRWTAVNAIISRMCISMDSDPLLKAGPGGKDRAERQKRARRSHRIGDAHRRHDSDV